MMMKITRDFAKIHSKQEENSRKKKEGMRSRKEVSTYIYTLPLIDYIP